MVTIPIIEEHIETTKHTIAKNSKEEDKFIKEIMASFSKMDALTVLNIDELEEIVLKFANIVERAWFKFSKPVRITKHSKSWWNDKCSQDLAKYCSFRNVEN